LPALHRCRLHGKPALAAATKLVTTQLLAAWMADQAPEAMGVGELKAALNRLRVRHDHCVEKSELLDLYKKELAGGLPRPTASTARPAAPAPAPYSAPFNSAPAPAPAGGGGGTYVNGKYVPPPAGMMDGMDWKTVAIVFIGLAWLAQNFGGFDGGGDYGDAEYDTDNKAYITGKVCWSPRTPCRQSRR
jgi:hypothetical protein